MMPGVTILKKGRHLIRQGALHKMCRKGLQERMVFLFSDILVYDNTYVHNLLLLCP